jgi:hypothetical protein
MNSLFLIETNVSMEANIEHWQLHIENESKTKVLRMIKNWLFLIKDIQWNDSDPNV